MRMDSTLKELLGTVAALIAVAGFSGLAVKIFTTTPKSDELAVFWVSIFLFGLAIIIFGWRKAKHMVAADRERLQEELETLRKYMNRSAGACCRSSHRLSDAISKLLHYQEVTSNSIARSQSFAELISIRHEISDKLEHSLCDFARAQSSGIKEKLQQYDKTRSLKKSYRIFLEIINAEDAENPNDICTWEVVNTMMDAVTWERVGCLLREQGKRKNPTVGDNLGFKALAVEQQDIFVCNNLDDLHKSSGTAYIEIDQARSHEYKAICMLPIRNTGAPGSSAIEDFYGFLVVDCTNDQDKNIFSDERNSVIRNLLSQEADETAVICGLLKLSSRDLFGMADEREATLRRNRRCTDQI